MTSAQALVLLSSRGIAMLVMAVHDGQRGSKGPFFFKVSGFFLLA